MLIVGIVWYFSVFTYNDKYKENPRFTFLRFKDKGHSFFVDDNNTYQKEFNTAFDKWTSSLDYDYKAKENKDSFVKDKADFIDANLDRKKWSNRLDIKLVKKFVNFYDDYLNLN
ncbi:hypothetical protein [Urinicoccus massiliensis]|uniref:hypothetical protein n=1 Tax=Urinicoccus massiliensis TaxID=1723382 RepID=UPI000931DBC6|nr:hypothetical protein [Urinicoccus massiliensis]